MLIEGDWTAGKYGSREKEYWAGQENSSSKGFKGIGKIRKWENG